MNGWGVQVEDDELVGFFEELGVTAARAAVACLAVAFFLGFAIGVLL